MSLHNIEEKLTIRIKKWWEVPTHRIWTIRIVILASQALLILGVAIFLWLNFVK